MTMTIFLVFVTFLTTMLSQAASQQFNCTLPDPPPGAPPPPDLSNAFTAHVEANIENRGYTANVVEYYDYPNNRGRIDFHGGRHGGGTEGFTSIYTFDDLQHFAINNTAGTCKAHTISAKSPFQPFGPVFGGGNAHIGGVYDLFRFGKAFKEVYTGKHWVRGILADGWRTCVNTSTGGNMAIDWYFVSGNWSIPSHRVSVPLRSVVEGINPPFHRPTVNGSEGHRFSHHGNRSNPFWNTTHYFKHNYEFTDFENGSPDPSLFQIPPGIFCDGSNTTKNLPKMPDSYSAKMQIFSHATVRHFQEYYDPQNQILFSQGSSLRFGEYSSYQDLNLGVVYVVGSFGCIVKNISSSTLTFPYEGLYASPSSSDPSHLSFRAVQDVWGFTSRYNVTYVGTRTVNGILCDVWQEENHHLSRANATILEVSFSKPSLGYTLIQNGSTEHQVPVKVEYYSKSLIGKPPHYKKMPWEYHLYINIYEFDVSPSRPEIDLVPCSKQFTVFWFAVRVKYAAIAKSLDDFEKAVVDSISLSAMVHLSRVANVHVHRTNQDGNLLVDGTILDKPNVPTYKDSGVSIDKAISNLKAAINSKQGLTITLSNAIVSAVPGSFTTNVMPIQPPTSKSTPASKNTTTPSTKGQTGTSCSPSTGSSGFSAGVLGGVTGASLVVGAALGAFILFCVIKMRGGFQMSYKTQIDLAPVT